ncbi:DUF3304 domain-containing protein [Pseudomonas sp. TKO14]|uniref:DUF3304 domain-containing protein n=1 Tax=unclassified Pseudomonas TaxID=196821 RepID=UPI0026A19811
MSGLIMEKFFASGLFGVLSVARGCLLVAGLLAASACQSESKMLSAPVTGYNHTSAAINRFSVNGAGGPNLGPHQGGGKQSCCGVVPRHWVPGLRAVVEWEKDPDPYSYGKWPERPYSDAWNKRMEREKQQYSRHKAIVEIPRYSVAGTLKVHFLPCNQVRVSADNIKVTDPRYLYNYPMEMEEPEVCPG